PGRARPARGQARRRAPARHGRPLPLEGAQRRLDARQPPARPGRDPRRGRPLGEDPRASAPAPRGGGRAGAQGAPPDPALQRDAAPRAAGQEGDRDDRRQRAAEARARGCVGAREARGGADGQAPPGRGPGRAREPGDAAARRPQRRGPGRGGRRDRGDIDALRHAAVHRGRIMMGEDALNPRSGFSTRAIHAGQRPDPSTGAITVPIYQTSTYVLEGLGKNKGYEYARTQNPTRGALEGNLASLEGGRHGLAFASGLASIETIMLTLQQGDHVVAGHNLYGGTYRLFERVMKPFGLGFTFVDTSDIAALAAAITDRTRLVFVETPTNPMMALTDIAAAAERAHARGAKLVVDNTFMPPYFQRPLEHGADVVVHSTTKYLNGHSDMVGGAVVLNDDALAERLRFLQNAVGAVPGPHDCWLVLRGTKTLAVRMERHDANARALAEHLARHPKVGRGHYPGPAHPPPPSPAPRPP